MFSSIVQKLSDVLLSCTDNFIRRRISLLLKRGNSGNIWPDAAVVSPSALGAIALSILLHRKSGLLISGQNGLDCLALLGLVGINDLANMLHEQIIVQLPNVLVGTQPKGQLGTRLGDGLSLFGVRFGPVKLLLEVGKVLLDRNVMLVGFHLVVEKVLGQGFVMKEQTRHEELGQGSSPTGTTSPTDINLIPMLGMDGVIGKCGGNDVGMSVKEGPVDGGRFSPILLDGESGIDPGEGILIAFGGLVVLLLVLLLLGIDLGLSLDGHGNGPPAGSEDVPTFVQGVHDILDRFKVFGGAAHDINTTSQLEVEGRKEPSPIGTTPVDLVLEILPLGSGVVVDLIEAGGDGTLAQNVALESITGDAR